MAAKKTVKTSRNKSFDSAAKVASGPISTGNANSQEVIMPFSRRNYVLLLIGVLIIGFGFFLLSLDGFVDAQEFSISLYVAPFIIMAGFAEIIYAIMYREKPAA